MTSGEIRTALDGDGTRAEALRARFAAHGQDHVFAFWDRLDHAARTRLVAQCARIDLDALSAAQADVAARAAAPTPALEPAPVLRLDELEADPGRTRRARERGETLLAEGRVAVLVVAGGQASRLGFPGPKGAYPIGPVSGRPLLGLQAQRLRRLRSRYGAAVPWLVMTSPATDAALRALVEAYDGFGLPRADVRFFEQSTMPALDSSGRLVLERPDRVFESPDGHGGVFAALARAGLLDELAQRGIRTVFYYQVDNPLVRIADPLYLGFHAEAGAEASCKVIEKREPAEKVGHLARVGGEIRIVEYTEIDAGQRDARGPDGRLRLWAGGISIHVFETALLERVAARPERWLRWHASSKKVPTVDAAGAPVTPEAPNAWKLERFVFDALPAARGVFVMETGRDEYSPVKNAEGSESPATARRDLTALYRGWLAEAGIPVPPEASRIEIDHSRLEGAEDFRAGGITRLAQAGDAIRIASGANP